MKAPVSPSAFDLCQEERKKKKIDNKQRVERRFVPRKMDIASLLEVEVKEGKPSELRTNGEIAEYQNIPDFSIRGAFLLNLKNIFFFFFFLFSYFSDVDEDLE